jgi:hypothetical protein
MLRSPHIFISFKTEERVVALQLKDALEANGFAVWWQESIQCGGEWHGEIDAALQRAGCVVVLWSSLSIHSPWVRHEASQAVARGVYAPVRLEPMLIGSPFDRIQATDLFNWKGDASHPGLLRLVELADRLVPAPRTRLERAAHFIWSRRLTVFALLLAASAVAVLAWLSLGLDRQLREVALATQRGLHPLTDMRVSAFITVPKSVPGSQEYIRLLREQIAAGKSGPIPKTTFLPPGVSPVRLGSDELIESLEINLGSPVWPQDSARSALGAITQYIGVNVAFTTDGSAAPDISFESGAYDPDDSERLTPTRRSGSLQWDLVSDTLTLHFWDVASKASWRAPTGGITSVLDLPKSEFRISISNTMFPRATEAKLGPAIAESRKQLLFDTIILEYAGHTDVIRGRNLSAEPALRDMPAYGGRFDRVVER